MTRQDLLAAAAALLLTVPAMAGGEIHGTVTLADGSSHTGAIRWDRNENFWNDTLDAMKPGAIEVESQQSTFTFLGFKLPWSHDQSTRARRSFSIPFGHLRSVQRTADGGFELLLKNGTSMPVEGTSDLGDGMRGFLVDEAEHGRVTLDWQEIVRVDFTPGTGRRDDQRLYGTVRGRSAEFTGAVIWDRDESLLEDELDGDDGNGDRALPFSSISAIHREGSSAARVVLVDGKELTLRGTNDVDSRNRGIMVQVAGMGTVEFPWEEFQSLTLAPAPASPAYSTFDGGHPLRGRVQLAGERLLEGQLIWDQDEEYSWETLDGDNQGLDYSIPFANIQSIQRLSRRSALVRLADGRSIELSGTNDVNEENKGIFLLQTDGSRLELDWSEFQAVEMLAP